MSKNDITRYYSSNFINIYKKYGGRYLALKFHNPISNCHYHEFVNEETKQE
jgi:hypothetical protein